MEVDVEVDVKHNVKLVPDDDEHASEGAMSSPTGTGTSASLVEQFSFSGKQSTSFLARVNSNGALEEEIEAENENESESDLDGNTPLTKDRLKFLRLLSEKYSNILAAQVEIVNLLAILELPRGTEHFVSDVHGEFEAFTHVLRNSSGLVRQIIDENEGLNLLGKKEKTELATMIYYPKQRLALQKKKNMDWYKITLRRILIVLKAVTFKYTRSKVRKNLPMKLSYIIQEMLTERKMEIKDYYESIIHNICKEGLAEDLIDTMSKVIQKLGVEDLHLLGDIWDRGPGPEKIMDYLMKNNVKVDFQFGNHDILWSGAASGSRVCIANIIRISLRYGNLNTLENGYCVSLKPLKDFTKKIYGTKKFSKAFSAKEFSEGTSEKGKFWLGQMQKAMFIIQMKLESEVYLNHPEYEMNNRDLLKKINFEKWEVEVDGKTYPLNDTFFPTLDPKKPTELTKEEKGIVKYFVDEFVKCKKLHSHIDFMFRKGSLYKIVNDNILYHACIPITKNVEFAEVNVAGKKFKGKQLMDRLDYLLKKQYFRRSETTDHSLSFFLWCNPKSPLFGKSKMATFERYLIDDKKTWVEEMGNYFRLRDDKRLLALLFTEFKVDKEKGHVFCGHVPVKKDSSPIRQGGKYITIDGGFAKTYQKVTGRAGYTMRCDSHGLYLCTHSPFESVNDAITNFVDLNTHITVLERHYQKVKDTDIGKSLVLQIRDCKDLIRAFKKRKIRQRYTKTKIVRY